MNTQQTPVYRPQVDVWNREDALILTASLPGVARESIDVQLDGDIVTIAAEGTPIEREGQRPIHREYETGRYHRTFRIREPLADSGLAAEYANGVLTVTLPRRQPAGPTRIDVRS